MHVLFCSTVFFIGLPCDSTRTIKGLVKVLCLIPSCIAKLVTSTVLKFCNSRACQWLVRVSKFPMAALENKTIWLRFRPKFFAFAFKHSTFRSREAKQPSSQPRSTSNSQAGRAPTKPMAPKSRPVRATLTAAPAESSTEQPNWENPGDDSSSVASGGDLDEIMEEFSSDDSPDPVQAGTFTAAQLAAIQDSVKRCNHSLGL